MSFLLIPVSPLSEAKSRLRDCFSQEQIQDLIIAMFKDLGETLLKVKCFKEKVVYCNSGQILELAEDYGLIGIKEEKKTSKKSFDEVIFEFNKIVINKFNAKRTIFTFLDVILISAKNFYDLNDLLLKNQLLVCPAIHSAGISVFGRNPPEIIPSFFSDPNTPSFISLLNNANKRKLKIAVYDSFRAGFDIDITQDLILAYKYLKIFNLKNTEMYLFLKKNLKVTLQKKDVSNNREFKIVEKRNINEIKSQK